MRFLSIESSLSSVVKLLYFVVISINFLKFKKKMFWKEGEVIDRHLNVLANHIHYKWPSTPTCLCLFSVKLAAFVNLIRAECGCLTNRKVILFTTILINGVIHQLLSAVKRSFKSTCQSDLPPVTSW